jgi:trehalose 6-phosphate phosphatase
VSDLPALLAALADRPTEVALFLDYDGTLAPIVDDPVEARPLDGAAAVLGRLGQRFGLVAVVSGRPATFLLDALGRPPAVTLVGHYGLEEVRDGEVVTAPQVRPWVPVVALVTGRALAEEPGGAEVEAKGLSVTLHWRRRPQAESRALAFAEREARRTGLVAQAGRMAVELRPPVEVDKGTVVRRLAAGHAAAAYFGDDLGDLPAFAALGELAATGMAVVRVAVADAGSPPEVADAADLVVEGPQGALEVLGRLAG